jgi:hypothetical protein
MMGSLTRLKVAFGVSAYAFESSFGSSIGLGGRLAGFAAYECVSRVQCCLRECLRSGMRCCVHCCAANPLVASSIVHTLCVALWGHYVGSRRLSRSLVVVVIASRKQPEKFEVDVFSMWMLEDGTSRVLATLHSP